jgi:SAM-dependent methyltransferase
MSERAASPPVDEVARIAERYARRSRTTADDRYGFTSPDVYMTMQERERAMMRWIANARIGVDATQVLEIGCGTGRNLLDLVRYGFRPENLTGNELLPERAAEARRRLPSEVSIIAGNALDLAVAPASVDIVLQSTVFTSVLDARFQQRLANHIWSWVRPGGGVLWYDFIYNNPANADVRGVPIRRIQQLFPEGRMSIQRLTLAPPVARLVTRVHPALYTVLNAIPLLRTHVLCWIAKAPAHDGLPRLQPR